jgi:hypothetical protein
MQVRSTLHGTGCWLSIGVLVYAAAAVLVRPVAMFAWTVICTYMACLLVTCADWSQVGKVVYLRT